MSASGTKKPRTWRGVQKQRQRNRCALSRSVCAGHQTPQFVQHTWIAFCQHHQFTLLAGVFAGSTPSIETNHQAILGSCCCRDACNTVSRIVRRKKCAVHHALCSRGNRLGGSGVRAKNGVVGNGVHVHVFQSAAPERCNGPIIGFTLIIFQFMLVMMSIHNMNKLPHKPCCFPMPWPEPCPPRLQP